MNKRKAKTEINTCIQTNLFHRNYTIQKKILLGTLKSLPTFPPHSHNLSTHHTSASPSHQSTSLVQVSVTAQTVQTAAIVSGMMRRQQRCMMFDQTAVMQTAQMRVPNMTDMAQTADMSHIMIAVTGQSVAAISETGMSVAETGRMTVAQTGRVTDRVSVAQSGVTAVADAVIVAAQTVQTVAAVAQASVMAAVQAVAQTQQTAFLGFLLGIGGSDHRQAQHNGQGEDLLRGSGGKMFVVC